MYDFNKIFVDDTKNVERVSTKEYLENGKIAIIDQGKDLIVGYTNYENYKICNEERIIFGDHTRVFKYINIPFITGADGTKVLKLIDTNKYNYKYFYYYLLHSYIPNTGYNRHFKWVKELKFKIPKIEKQIEIANKLDKIQEIIDLRKKQIEELDEIIKSQFVEMFGNPILNNKNFDLYKWNEVLTIKNGKNQKKVEKQNGEYPIYGSGGIMSYATDYICNENSVIIGRKGNINRPILVRSKFWNVDTAFGLEPNKDKLIAEYLYYFCDFYNFEKHNKAVTIPSLIKKDLLNINIPLPDIELQNQFAEFVKQIDKQKLMMKKSLKETEELQESLMNKYFN